MSFKKLREKFSPEKTKLSKQQLERYFRNLVTAILIFGAAKEMQGQTNPNRPLNELQISQVNALGGVSFDAQSSAQIEETLNKHALEMQNTYDVHIDLAYTIVRINYLATGLTVSGDEITDLNNIKNWVAANTQDPRDLNAGFYLGNAYSGAAQQGPDTNGFRFVTIASPQGFWLLNHEDKHSVDALSQDHHEGVTGISFTATNVNTGAQNSLSDGYTAGKPAGTSGTRLQYISVSNAKNTGNPANGGDGNTKHIGSYFGLPDPYEISAPYTELANPSGENTADKVADYYAAGGPGHDFRNEAVATPTIPLAQVAGDVISLTNSGAYNNQYPNTTNAAFENTYATPAKYELYLYDAANATDHNQIAGPIEITENFAGLASGDYKLGVYEKYGNTAIQFSSTITVSALGLEDQEIAGFTMYPNPVKMSQGGKLNINANDPLEKIAVYDRRGELVKEINPQGAQNFGLFLPGVSSGLYLIRISTDKASTSQKLIIE